MATETEIVRPSYIKDFLVLFGREIPLVGVDKNYFDIRYYLYKLEEPDKKFSVEIKAYTRNEEPNNPSGYSCTIELPLGQTITSNVCFYENIEEEYRYRLNGMKKMVAVREDFMDGK